MSLSCYHPPVVLSSAASDELQSRGSLDMSGGHVISVDHEGKGVSHQDTNGTDPG